MNMPLAEIRRLALANLRRSPASPLSESDLGQAVLDALVQAGVDLKSGPTLEEMKALLADVARLAHEEQREHVAA